jgi:membrane protein YdbS with pleckstrin-like domain
MTRGLPAVWSAVFGAPFVAVGAYVFAFQSQYPLVANQPTAPPAAGVPLAAFGLFVVALGVYVQFASTPDRPTMRDGEWIVDERDPAQRSALAKTFAAVPFLAAGLDLLYFTTYPLVYPTLALAAGLYVFSTGIHEYWRNTLTSYLVTNRRVLEEYRFVSLARTEVPLEKVRAVEERRSAFESLFGLGGVHVRAGSTGDLSVTVRSVYDSTAFADEIREEIDRTGDATRTAFDGYVEATPVDAATDDAVDADESDAPSVLDAEGSVESLDAADATFAEAEPRSDGGTDEPIPDADSGGAGADTGHDHS